MRYAYRTIHFCGGIQGQHPAPDRSGFRNRLDGDQRMKISVKLGSGEKLYFSSDSDAWKFIQAVFDTIGYADNCEDVKMEVKFERERDI